MQGKVKWFNSQRGFGFINDGKNDVFVHYTAINGEGYRTLDEGDTVTFDVVADEKGSHAVNVSKVQ